MLAKEMDLVRRKVEILERENRFLKEKQSHPMVIQRKEVDEELVMKVKA